MSALSRFGLAVRIRFGSPFSSKIVVCGHCVVTLSLVRYSRKVHKKEKQRYFGTGWYPEQRYFGTGWYPEQRCFGTGWYPELST